MCTKYDNLSVVIFALRCNSGLIALFAHFLGYPSVLNIKIQKHQPSFYPTSSVECRWEKSFSHNSDLRMYRYITLSEYLSQGVYCDPAKHYSVIYILLLLPFLFTVSPKRHMLSYKA